MLSLTDDERFMRAAIKQAKKAEEIDEVPIGCVITYEGKIIARGYNKRKKEKSTLAHAEIAAIRKACRKMGDWRLEGCTMYVTLEPCPMCAGAIVMSRVDRVVYGSTDAKAGACESVFNIPGNPTLNHRPEITAGVLQQECADIMKRFFKMRREQRKAEKQKNNEE